MKDIGLLLPLAVVKRNRDSYEIRDAIGRRIATITSNRFDCAAQAAFDAHAAAHLWADAANAPAKTPMEAPV